MVICLCFWDLYMFKVVKSLNFFISKIAEQVLFKLHVAPCGKKDWIFFLNSHGQLSKVAAIPIYGRKDKNQESFEAEPNLCILHPGLNV